MRNGYCLSVAAALAVGAIASVSNGALAKAPFLQAFLRAYPAARGTVLERVSSNNAHCGVCHYNFNGGGDVNPYAEVAHHAIHSGLYDSDEEAIRSVELLDSDGDGYTNLVEIMDVTTFGNTPTFPGLTSDNVRFVSNVDLSDIQAFLTPTGAEPDTIPPTVAVLSPNGGEVLQAHASTEVTWSATDERGIARIDIYISDDAGLAFTSIAVGEPNDGIVSWAIHNPRGEQKLIRVVALDSSGNSGEDWSDGYFSINEPAGSGLLGDHPNPFAEGTTIRYSLTQQQHVTLRIYNVRGQIVKTLVDDVRPAGGQTVFWDGTNQDGHSVTSGIYFYRMTTKGYDATHKLLRVR